MISAVFGVGAPQRGFAQERPLRGIELTIRGGIMPSPKNLAGCQHAYGSLGAEAKTSGQWFSSIAYDWSFRIEGPGGVPCVIVRRPALLGRESFGETLDLGGATRLTAAGGRFLPADPISFEVIVSGGALHGEAPGGDWHPWAATSLRVVMFGRRIIVGAEQGITRSTVLYRTYAGQTVVEENRETQWSTLTTISLGVRVWR